MPLPGLRSKSFVRPPEKIEADESEERLDDALRKIAKSRPAEASKDGDNPKSK